MHIIHKPVYIHIYIIVYIFIKINITFNYTPQNMALLLGYKLIINLITLI